MFDILKIERISIIERGDLVIDPQFHLVKIAGKEVHLYPKEYEVLCFLAQYSGWVLSSKQIYQAVWNEEDGPYDTLVCNAVSKIRKKLNRPDLIERVWKYGYRFNG